MNAPIVIDDADVEAPVAPIGWHIKNEDDAAFAVDRIIALEEQLDRLEKQYEKNATRVVREIERARSFFEPHLQDWYAKHPPKKGRTLHLATGDIGYRRTPGHLHIDNVDACIEWAEAHFPECIAREVVRHLDKERVKREAHKRMSAAIVEAGTTGPAPTNNDELRAHAAYLHAVGRAALPDGVVLKPDADTFSVRSPKGGR